MAKIFMLGFVFRGVRYASNVFCQERHETATYHLKLVNHYPHLFTGTLILQKSNGEFKVNSPSTFHNDELLTILVDALKSQELAEQ